MKKSLFLKQFIIYMSILLFSFILLGFVFTNAFKAYYLQQRQQLLVQQADRISQQYSLGIYTGIVDWQNLRSELKILSDNMLASAILVERTGRVMFVSDNIDSKWVGSYVSEASFAKAMKDGEIVTENITGSLFEDTALTVIYPIKIEGFVFAALVMNISVPGVKAQLMNVYTIIFAVLALCAVIAFAALYFSVKRITKPLIEINKAAKVIAGGDFEKRIQTDLVDEVGQLAQSFNEMAEGLSKLEENKRLFISNISHDIRSPLTSIQGFVTAMLDGTAPPESFERYLNIVKDESKRIINLANNMIDLNGLQEYIVCMTEFDINALIRKCAAKYENDAKVKGLYLDILFFENMTMVKADYEVIERVICNLLDNAIKFTKKGGVTIETDVGTKVWVSITDTGIGIEQEQQKHIFDRFYKADGSRSGNTNGNGLGLSIVKEFIKAHDETVTVQSEPNKGSAFKFSLLSCDKYKETGT